MATKTITRVLCDMPHDEDVDALPITVTTPDGTWDVDLCPDHAAEYLMPVLTEGRAQRRTRRARVPSDA